jgi:hypothetical protein
MLENVQKIIHLIGKKFPESVFLSKPESKVGHHTVAYFFKIAPESKNLLCLLFDNNDTWTLTRYESPSEEAFQDFLTMWTKWGFFNKILDWKHEEVNLIE